MIIYYAFENHYIMEILDKYTIVQIIFLSLIKLFEILIKYFFSNKEWRLRCRVCSLII